MEFEKIFNSWLDANLSQSISDDVKAFSFNLYEPVGAPGVKFGIELIGAGAFHEDDPDWPCEEVWEPETRGIDIPIAYSGDDWESCLSTITTLVKKQLSENSETAQKLKSTEGIGVGFVDGDLKVIWMRSV